MHSKRLRFSNMYYCYIISHLQGPYQLQNAISRVYGSHYESQTVWRSPHVYTGRNHYTNKTVCSHYGDVIMNTVASQITSLASVYSTFSRVQIKENIKAPRHWPSCREFTGHRWVPRTNGQWRGKCFHLMTSSCWWIEVQKTSCSVDGIPMKQWFRIRGIYFVP